MIRQARLLARLFICALQFLTRLPTPRLREIPPNAVARSVPWYPVVGWIVGAITAAAYWVASRLWPGLPAAVFAIAVSVLVTGGFHEDGLADAADGLGGGATPARRLEIMKDSRIGSYGAIALWCGLSLKAAALASLSPAAGALALVLSHGAARALVTPLMAALPYAGDAAKAKLASSAARVRVWEAGLALVLGLLPLAFARAPIHAGTGLALALVGAAAMGLIARRLIGGYTGDILGAAEQIAEVALLLGFSLKLAT